MCDQDHFEKDRQDHDALGLVITRRQFGVLVGAGVTMMLPQVANAVAVTESDVNIKTPDGTADAYFVHPATGTAPGVLVWPDIFGLRPAFRQMAKRLAENGYSVLVVNPFYRVKKAPTAEQGSATPIPQLMPLAQALNETTQMTDAKAFVAWLDGQASVAKNRKVGTQGYCMGGPIAFRTRLRCRSRRRGRLVPRRRPRHRHAEQPASAGLEDQGAVPDRHRRQRRHAIAE
jgi:carboxymethylenebutenolidase